MCNVHWNLPKFQWTLCIYGMKKALHHCGNYCTRTAVYIITEQWSDMEINLKNIHELKLTGDFTCTLIGQIFWLPGRTTAIAEIARDLCFVWCFFATGRFSSYLNCICLSEIWNLNCNHSNSCESYLTVDSTYKPTLQLKLTIGLAVRALHFFACALFFLNSMG